MKSPLKKAFEQELSTGISLYRQNRERDAMKHFENAHVLAQRWVVPHFLSHWWILKVEARRRSFSGICGQIVRIILGAIGSAIENVPHGNTGGTDISMFRSLPIDDTLRKIIDDD